MKNRSLKSIRDDIVELERLVASGRALLLKYPNDRMMSIEHSQYEARLNPLRMDLTARSSRSNS